MSLLLTRLIPPPIDGGGPDAHVDVTLTPGATPSAVLTPGGGGATMAPGAAAPATLTAGGL